MNVALTAKSYAGPGILSLSLRPSVPLSLSRHHFNFHLTPKLAIAAGTGTLAAIGTTYVLPAVGFCAAGVKAGSVAAGVQASVYGAAVPAGSIFATLQSWGTTKALTGTLGAVSILSTSRHASS